MLVGLGRQRADADDQVRLVERRGRREVVEVELRGHVGAAGVEVVGVCERDPEHARQLGAVARRPEQRDDRRRTGGRRRPEPRPHAALAAPVAEHPHHVDHVARELLDRSACGCRPNAEAVIWSAPGARPMPRSIRPGCSASSSRELLGDRERCVVRAASRRRSRRGSVRWQRRRGRSARRASCSPRSACCGARRPRSAGSRGARRRRASSVVSANASRRGAAFVNHRQIEHRQTPRHVRSRSYGRPRDPVRSALYGAGMAIRQGVRDRDRVRHRRARRRQQPGVGLVAADQLLRQRHLDARSAGTSRTRRRPTTPAGSTSTTCSRRRSRRRSSTPCCPTVPATTSTTPTPRSRRRRSPPRSTRCAGTVPPTRSSGRRWSTPTQMLRDGAELVVYKNNSDGKGNIVRLPRELPRSSRETPFGRIVAQITPHFVTRQIFCGAGQGRVRAARTASRRGAVPARASGPTSSRRRSGSRPRSSARSSTPATNRTATRRSTAGCT